MSANIVFDNTPSGREMLFLKLYESAFPAVAKYVSRRGGTFDDAKDIFQDALVIYYEKLVDDPIEFKFNEQAYLVGISKHLWLSKFRDDLHYTAMEPGYDLTEAGDQHLSNGKLLRYLETAGQKCMELLKAFYYENLSAECIASVFGYSGVRSATVQKYKCMEKVRETVKEKSLAYEDFVE